MATIEPESLNSCKGDEGEVWEELDMLVDWHQRDGRAPARRFLG